MSTDERASNDALLGGGLVFNRSTFHDLNEVLPEHRWSSHLRRRGRLVGSLEGVVTGDTLVSGHSAPFGGPELASTDATVDDAMDLVAGAVARARDDGLATMQVRARPTVYSAVEPLLEYALMAHGFEVTLCALNQHVALDPPPHDPLVLLRKNRRAGVRDALAVCSLDPVRDEQGLAVVHRIIADNRRSLGRPDWLPVAYLADAVSRLGDRVMPFLLHHDGEPVASAVVYRVLDDVDLLVAWADVRVAGRRSPMDVLAHLLVRDAIGRGSRVLDLGPSSEPTGEPNVGLASFKRSVGAVVGTRKILSLRIA